jgi:esterase FrsA
MYIYDIDPQAMFDDRTHQFRGFGIPLADINRVRGAVTDMWADSPGGWVYEWSRLAESYAAAGNHALAAYAYGCAKFPCLNSQARTRALRKQLEQYELAAKTFPVRFERRIISVRYSGTEIEVPVHLFSVDGDYSARPVLLAHGGVDTFKMDFHPFCVAFTMYAGVTTLAIDMPGTGESTVPLDVSGDELISGVIAFARAIGDGRVAHFGLSFGGNFSAMSGLTELADAAVNLGGPVLDSFTTEVAAKLPYGMRDIVGNAMHFDHVPSLDELSGRMADLRRRELLSRQFNSPMLVINGADDYFVPQSDTLVFEGRPDTEVHLLDGTGHCALSKANEVIPMINGWLQKQFAASITQS